MYQSARGSLRESLRHRDGGASQLAPWPVYARPGTPPGGRPFGAPRAPAILAPRGWHGLLGGAVVSVRVIVEDLPVRRRLAALLLVSLSACVGSGSTSKPPASQDPCADFEVEVEKFWSASVRAKAMNHGGEIEIEKRSGVVNKMDRISEDWVMMRTSVCKDHFVRELITKEQYAARVQCFDDRLERQRTLATALTGAGADLATIEGSLDELIAAPKSCESPEQ